MVIIFLSVTNSGHIFIYFRSRENKVSKSLTILDLRTLENKMLIFIDNYIENY